MAFTNSTGRPLQDYYDQKDLVDFLERNTFFDKHANTLLPPLLVFHTRLGESIYINKTRVLSAVAQLITEAQPHVRQGISDYWSDSLRRFCQEPSMKIDKEFEKLVTRYMDKLAPKLMMFLNDKKLFLVQDEMISIFPDEVYRNVVIYQTDGTMRPFSNLLKLNRRTILADVKIMLPIWYSIPLFFLIGSLFFRKKKSKKKKNTPYKERPNIQRPAPSVQAIKQAAVDYQQQKLPPEKNLEQYLEELEDQWLRMVSPENKKQLVQDVRSQIKARLKISLEVRKNMPITPKSIDEIADGIIMASPFLVQLGIREKVHKYVALYISSLLT
jgi:predicted helicase